MGSERKEISAHDEKWYKSRLESFVSTVAADLAADDVTQTHVDKWFAKFGAGWGDNHRLGCYRSLLRLYNWAGKRKLVSDNPIRGMEQPSYQPRDCYLTDEQWNPIIGATNNQALHDILTFIKHTGWERITSERVLKTGAHQTWPSVHLANH